MQDYNYWIEHVRRFTETYGPALEIDDCVLRISDYGFDSPQVGYTCIQMPIQYLEFLNLHTNLILSNQNLFKDIGNSENEKLNKENFNDKNYPVNIKMFLEINKHFWNTIPFDNQRKYYAGLLRDLITSFAIYHEIGHIRQKSYNGYNVTEEVGAFEIKEETKWAEQAEEIDADIFAINFVWRNIFYNFHQFPNNSPFKSTRELLCLSLYSSFLFFYLSNNDDKLYDPLKEHPHPIVRSRVIGNFLQKIVELNELCNKEEFNQIVHSVLHQFDSTLKYHFNSTDNKTYYTKYFSRDVFKAMSKLQEYFSQNAALNTNRPYTIL